MEETKTKSKERTFYIRVSNMSVENGKPLFVGPFENSEQAEGVINQAMYNGQEIMTGDEFINDQTLNVSIVGGTAAKREGMKEPLGEMPKIEKWMGYFSDGELYKSNRGRPKKDEGAEQEETPKKTSVSTKKSKDTTSVTISSKPSKKIGVVIVSNNPSIISWLVTEKGYQGAEVISYVSHPAQIAGKIVIGIVPTWLLCHAERQGIVNIPGVRKDEPFMSPDEITRKNGKIDWYSVPKFLSSE